MPSASLKRRALLALATSATFERAVKALPAGEDRAWRSARRYVAGREAGEALAVARRLRSVGLHASIDLFGERTPPAEAPAVARAYVALARRLADEAPVGTWLSLDLSHIAFDGGLLDEIAAAVPPGRRLQVGAEEAAHADRIRDLVLGAAARGRAVEATLQANLRRAPGAADRFAAAGVPVRLVKGAYVEDRRDALPRGLETEEAFARLARRLHSAGADVALATHDAPLRERLLAELGNVRCELLFGVRPADAVALARAGRDVRVYVPYGDAWFRYFMRRRAESQST